MGPEDHIPIPPCPSRPLPQALRRHLERLTGHRLEDVRWRVDAGVARFGALALAQGDEIVLAPECWRCSTQERRQVFAHELIHVLQQRLGHVRQRPGQAVVKNRRLEAEACQLGDRLAAGRPIHFRAGLHPRCAVVQCFPQPFAHGGAERDRKTRERIAAAVTKAQAGTLQPSYLETGANPPSLRVNVKKRLADSMVHHLWQCMSGPNQNAPDRIRRLYQALELNFQNCFGPARVPGYEAAEMVRQALLQTRAATAFDQEECLLALRMLGQHWNGVLGTLQYADWLSGNDNKALRGWYETGSRLDLYDPELLPLEAFLWNFVPALTAPEKAAIATSVRRKVRYCDLRPNVLLQCAQQTELLKILACEVLTPARVRDMLQGMGVNDLCALLREAFGDDEPYPFVREGGYRISQVLLQMARRQGAPNLNHAVLNDVRSEGALVDVILCLRSGFYLAPDLDGLVTNGAGTVDAFCDAIAAIDRIASGRARARYAGLVAFIQAGRDRFDALNANLHRTPDEQKEFELVPGFAALLTWLDTQVLGGHVPHAEHAFCEMLRVFGDRVFVYPEWGSAWATAKSRMMGAFQLLANFNTFCSHGMIQYRRGLSRLAFVLPTAGKRLEEFTFIESLVEGLELLIETINRPPVTYYRDEAADPLRRVFRGEDVYDDDFNTFHVRRLPGQRDLQAIPVIIFDQSVPVVLAANRLYTAALAVRTHANIQHVDMGQIIAFGRLVEAPQFFATEDDHDAAWWNVYVDNPAARPRAGYAGARNIAFLIGPVFHEALARGDVNDFAGLLALGAIQLKIRLRRALNGLSPGGQQKPRMILMGDDDLTLMPGLIHAKAMLASKLGTGHWRFVTRMMGRMTTVVPTQSLQFHTAAAAPPAAPGLRLGLRAFESTQHAIQRASKFHASFSGETRVWHNFAGVAMHLQSCQDIPLPSEEIVFNSVLACEDILSLSIHHPGDRYQAEADQRGRMARYVSQIRVATQICEYGGAAVANNSDVLPWNRHFRAQHGFRTLGAIYNWILAAPALQVAMKRKFFLNLFTTYLPDNDPFLVNDPETIRGNLRLHHIGTATYDHADFQFLRDAINAEFTAYRDAWKEVNVAHRFRVALWERFLANYQLAHPGPKNRTTLADATLVVDHVLLNVPNLAPMIDAARNAVWDLPNDVNEPILSRGNYVTWRDGAGGVRPGMVATAVYMATVSYGKSRFFTLLDNIMNQ